MIAYRKGVIESGKDRNGHLSWPHLFYPKGWSGGNMGVRPLGPKEIDGLLVPPGKANTLLADHLITS